MKKTLLAIIIVIIVLAGGVFAYKAYKQNQMQNSQLTIQSQTIQQSSKTSSRGNTVDQSSSPQEQQAQQNLNSLDGGDHN